MSTTESGGLTVPEIAYYYPERYWTPDEHAWIKSLLLFFDEVALLVPNYKRHQPAMLDPVVAGALQDRGLLRIIEPEQFVDGDMTASLAEAMVALIEAGGFDDLSQSVEFAELSMSRAGYFGERELAHDVVERLRERGLATESADGWSIPMHPAVRSTYLVLLAQLARKGGVRHGLDLHPTTNRVEVRDILDRTLNLGPMPTRGRVIDFDLEAVSIDVDDVDLDALLAFRDEHRFEHRRYMANLRSFCRELSAIEDETDRARLLSDRREELKDEADALRSRAWRSFKKPKNAVSFGLGLIGAGVAFAGNPVGGGLALGSQLLRLLPDKDEGSVYSYLFSARSEL